MKDAGVLTGDCGGILKGLCHLGIHVDQQLLLRCHVIVPLVDHLTDPLLERITDHAVSNVADELLVEGLELLVDGQVVQELLVVAPSFQYVLDG